MFEAVTRRVDGVHGRALRPALGRLWPLVDVAVAVALVLGGWAVTVRLVDVPAILLPSPIAVAHALAAHAAAVAANAVYTGREIALGWAAGVGAGVVLAVAMALSRRLRLFLGPILLAVRVVPLVVFAPVFVLLVGPTLATRVLMAAILTFFPVAVATLDGLRSVPQSQVDLLAAVGAPRWKRVLTVHLPNALPGLFAGLKIATPLAVEGVVIAEFLAASRGIGHAMIGAQNRLQTALLFGYLAVLVALGLAVYGVVVLLDRVAGAGDSGAALSADSLWTTDSDALSGAAARPLSALAALLAVAALWALAATVVPHARLFLAGPVAVARSLASAPGLYLSAATATAAKLATGWALDALAGATLGAVVALVPPLRTVVATYLVGFRVLPVIAFAPVLLVWLGVSFASGVVIVAASTFFPVAVGTAAGLRQLPTVQRDLLASVDAPARAAMRVRLRYAAPTLFAGVKLSIVTALAGVIVAEWFVASAGLGVLVLQQTRSFQSALALGAVAVAFAIGASLFGLASLAQRSLRW
ncbi:MAG: ABC transporter permease [Haloarculaceae archaeon]